MKDKNIFKDNESVAAAFAKYLAAQIKQANEFHLALSGGSTPKILFDCLSKDYADKIDWKKVHLYWGDERCVAPDHPDSNYGMTFMRLIRHIKIPSENIHRVLGENNPTQEVFRYEEEIKKNVPIENSCPIFDLIILGMGSDGHTASIFPHQMELLTVDQFCGLATHPSSGQLRVSITGKVINAAKQVHFLVTGASKKKVVQEIFSKTAPYKDYPASHISKATWWLDEAATHI